MVMVQYGSILYPKDIISLYYNGFVYVRFINLAFIFEHLFFNIFVIVCISLVQRTITKGKWCTMVKVEYAIKNETTSVLYAKWHINTTIDTSFSIQITKPYLLLFWSISFSNWDGYRPYFFSCQNKAHGLVKLGNIKFIYFFCTN